MTIENFSMHFPVGISICVYEVEHEKDKFYRASFDLCLAQGEPEEDPTVISIGTCIMHPSAGRVVVDAYEAAKLSFFEEDIDAEINFFSVDGAFVKSVNIHEFLDGML